jgi:hypothetical protein
MGGGASVLAAESDPQITALTNLAAAETNPSAISAAANVVAPALVFAASLDCVAPPDAHQIPIYESLASSCRTYVSITGGSHCQFAASNFFCNLGEGGCDPPTITRGQQQAIVHELVVPWFDYWLKDDAQGWETFQALIAAGDGITSEQDCEALSTVEPAPAIDCREIRMAHGCPNPFAGSTSIALRLPAPAWIAPTVRDVRGRTVRRFDATSLSAGVHHLHWDGRDNEGHPLPGGIYLYSVQSDGIKVTRKLALVR